MIIIVHMSLNFFFDIDGTLIPFGRNLLESTAKALLFAKSQGHRLFLCTGRASFEVLPQLYSFPFDGGVYSAGAELVVGPSTIFRAQASPAQTQLFWDVVKRYHLLWLIQSNDKTYTTEATVKLHQTASARINGAPVYLSGVEVVPRFPSDKIMTKMFIMSDNALVLQARQALEGPFHCENNTTGFPSTMAAEVMLSGISKSFGIRRILQYLSRTPCSDSSSLPDGQESSSAQSKSGVGAIPSNNHLGDVSYSVGIGDGENDIDMIDYCDLGIAMGNACQVLKDHADYVTSDILDDGLAKAVYHAIEVFS